MKKLVENRKRCSRKHISREMEHVWNAQSDFIKEGQLCLCGRMLWLNGAEDAIGLDEYTGTFTPIV